jgi:5,10-methylenetetrahydromethanopterin reductase
MFSTNQWDPAALDAFRADDMVSKIGGAIDANATTKQLEQGATAIELAPILQVIH